MINNAKPIVGELRANQVRVDSDFSATPFKAKISNVEQLRVHTTLVIGGRDMEAGAVIVQQQMLFQPPLQMAIVRLHIAVLIGTTHRPAA